MRTHTALPLEAGLAGLLTAATASGAPAMGPTPEHQSPEVTLYFSIPIGIRESGVPSPKIGLGFGEVQVAGNLGNPATGDPIRRRELLRFEVAPRRAEPARELRLTLGGRMTYDLSRGVFGWRNGRATPEPPEMRAPLAAADRKSDGCCRPQLIPLQIPGDLLIHVAHASPSDRVPPPVALAK